MTLVEFNFQMQRLQNSYPGFKPTTEIMELLFICVESLPAAWLAEWVKEWIFSNPRAPLPKDLREDAEIERTKRNFQAYQVENEKIEEDELKDSIFTDEDRQMILKNIMLRMNGQLADDDFEKFNKMLIAAIESNPKKSKNCKYCDNRGVIVTRKSNYAYKCICLNGQSDDRKYPMAPTALINKINEIRAS